MLPSRIIWRRCAATPVTAAATMRWVCSCTWRGKFAAAEPYFRKAIERLTLRNPNPYDGEPYCNLGLTLKMLGRYREAFDSFYKAVWSAALQASAYFELGRLAAGLAIIPKHSNSPTGRSSGTRRTGRRVTCGLRYCAIWEMWMPLGKKPTRTGSGLDGCGCDVGAQAIGWQGCVHAFCA